MTNYSLLTEASLTADWGSYQPCWLPRIQTTRMSHKSKQYLTNPKPRLLYQSWGSDALIPPSRQFSCPPASCPVTFIEQYDYTPMANLWTTSLHEANYCMIRLFQSGMFTYDPYDPLVTCTHPHFTLTHTPSWGLGYVWSHRTIFVSGYTE